MKRKVFDLTMFSIAFKSYLINERYSFRQASKIVGASAATLCRIANGEEGKIDTILTICEWINKPITKFVKSKK